MVNFITGATGFIGKVLVKKLSDQGKKVRCLVRENSDVEYLRSLDIDLRVGDILDTRSILSAIEGVDYIYHLAAYAHPSIITPYKVYKEININGTKNILECAYQKGVKRILIVSSIAATGPSRDGKLLTEDSELMPITNYGKSKAEVERLALKYGEEKDLHVVVIRPPMVYGIGNRDWLGFFKLIQSHGYPFLGIPVPGTHENLFDFCYVENLASGMIKALDSIKTKNRVYFLSDERTYRLKEIIQTISDELQIEYPKKNWSKWFTFLIAYMLEFLGYIFRFDPPLSIRDVKWMTRNYWVCNCQKAKDDFGYNPKISLKEGMQKTFNWYRANNYL